jgi:hypothetical protein
MAKGYAGASCQSCRCCHSGPKEKFYCEPCDHVCKAPLGWQVTCPTCREPMLNMGHRWRPGPKGDRMRHYPEGYRVHVREGDVYPPKFRVVTVGGHGYKTRPAPRWLASGTKLRRRGRIRSVWVP